MKYENGWRRPVLSLSASVLLVLFFLSVAANASSEHNQIRVTAVGDIMLGTTYPEERLPPNDGKDVLTGIGKTLQGSDIVFGNLEGPVLEGGTPAKCADKSPESCYEFRMPPRYLKYVASSGFNVMNIANNHVLDFGREGLISTITALTTAGIMPVGFSKTTHFVIRNKRVVVAGFSYVGASPAGSILHIAKATALIRNLKKRNDIVIVSFHGGAEGKGALHVANRDEVFAGEERGNVVRFSRAAVDAGADLVIGHGPHVVRALEVYRGKLIAYSLGNFIAYGRFNTTGLAAFSMILKANIDSATGKFVSGRIVPLKLEKKGLPFVDPQAGAVKLVRALVTEDIRNPCLVIRDTGEIFPAPAGLVKPIPVMVPWYLRYINYIRSIVLSVISRL